jgi:hypothetical protein
LASCNNTCNQNLQICEAQCTPTDSRWRYGNPWLLDNNPANDKNKYYIGICATHWFNYLTPLPNFVPGLNKEKRIKSKTTVPVSQIVPICAKGERLVSSGTQYTCQSCPPNQTFNEQGVCVATTITCPAGQALTASNTCVNVLPTCTMGQLLVADASGQLVCKTQQLQIDTSNCSDFTGGGRIEITKPLGRGSNTGATCKPNTVVTEMTFNVENCYDTKWSGHTTGGDPDPIKDDSSNNNEQTGIISKLSVSSRKESNGGSHTFVQQILATMCSITIQYRCCAVKWE